MASGVVLVMLMMMSCWACSAAAAAALNMSPVPFHAAYLPLFGGDNLVRSPDGRTVQLKLDRRTGSGFVSKSAYYHGFFSASIKLPDVDYTAGVVVAFYLSNGEVFPANHDELDFELLGNRPGHGWRLQTNMYGNGSTSRGREERYLLPFDPTAAPHRYAVAWTPTAVIFYIDGVPIREVVRSAAMRGDFPSKPMSVYATIWDGSSWATDGGRHKVDYAYAPFVADFSGLVLAGCTRRYCGGSDVELLTSECAVMTAAKRGAMRRFRERYMTYSACHDRVRYNGTAVFFPECDASERPSFHRWGESKLIDINPTKRAHAHAAAAGAGGVRID